MIYSKRIILKPFSYGVVKGQTLTSGRKIIFSDAHFYAYLIFSIELQIIPHLFIPENNLIDHLSTQECLKVAKILTN